TPNRPDCLSVLGVARELAALTGAPLRPPPISLREGRQRAADLARVRVEAPDLCPRYTVRIIDGVRVAPSPAWMQSRLRAVGLRPISNVVDVTNYVLWELGHPLHAFDATRVADATIVARTAQLIAELAGGVVARGVIDVYPRKRRPVRVRLRMARVKRVLGVAPPPAQARRILAGLGLGVRARGADLDVTVPSFRRDLAI